MQGNDISNRLPPRWLIVFEGVIAELPEPSDRAAFNFYRRTRAYKRAVRTYQVNTHTAKVLWDMVWRRDYKFDVVTFLPSQCTEHVRDWIDEHNIPAANVRHYPSPAHLAQQLAYLPDVYAVVHAEAANRFTYGDRGMLVDQGWNI